MTPFIQLLGAIAGIGAASGQIPTRAGSESAILALLAAALAQRDAPAIPSAPAQPVRLPWVVSAISFLWIAVFALTSVATVAAIVLGQGALHDALNVLCLVLGVEAAGAIMVLCFWVSSSFGSYSKSAWGRLDGQRVPVVTPAPLTLPASEVVPAIPGVGRSTDPSTKNKRADIAADGRPASIRYNNPGAQYPSVEAARFGQIGYGVIGGGHKIALFPHAINGAASNFDLLRRGYVGMQFGAAGKKWTGSNRFGIPGYSDETMLTADMVDDPAVAVPIMKAIARREAGEDSPLTEMEWRAAHAMFRAGSADAWLSSSPTASATRRPIGADLVALARKFIGRPYAHTLVPKDDATYAGPFDCAELASYVVYQVTSRLYGCTDDNAKPSVADAYTGAWKRDAGSLGNVITVAEAARTPGAFVLRYPPSGAGGMGHIALSVGDGSTIEAKSTNEGVTADKISQRRWDIGVLIPWVDYGRRDDVAVAGPTTVYAIGQPNMRADVIHSIQSALKDAGYDPGAIDSEFGLLTAQAVTAFQISRGLVEDGEVGPQTAAALGIKL